MTPLEDLKGMSHEDLVVRIQELEETIDSLKRERDDWCRFYTNVKAEYEHFRNAIYSVMALVKK